MAENPNPGGFNRLACVIFPSSAGSTAFPIQRSCITGEVDMKHLRHHLKTTHKCHAARCAKPCGIAAHCLSDKIKDILKIRKKRSGTDAEAWIRMFKKAYPYHENTPAPYLPCPGQLLALTQHPTEEFMKTLGSAFANSQTVGTDIQAQEMVHNFCQLFPTFYDVVSRTGPLPDFQIGLQPGANSHHQGTVFSPDRQRGLELFEPSRDIGSAVTTRVIQQDLILHTDAGIDVPDCNCDGQPMVCQECLEKAFDNFE